jgi:transposase InsO family protein
VGPLPTAQGNLKFAFVFVEYYTKWIKAGAVSTITTKTTQKILAKHRLPFRGTLRINDRKWKTIRQPRLSGFCASLGSKVVFTSVYHPQSNGIVERANGKIFTAIKKRLLKDKKGKWVDQLPEVHRALNTTESHATGFTPFRLMYRAEAMTPQRAQARFTEIRPQCCPRRR